MYLIVRIQSIILHNFKLNHVIIALKVLEIYLLKYFPPYNKGTALQRYQLHKNFLYRHL